MAATAENLPAYPGARFNSSGFCTNHSNVRLCVVTNEGKYKILRKTCFKCGSSSLMNNFTRITTNKMHGRVKKDLPSRDLPKGIFSATASSNGGSGSDTKKNQQPSTSRLRGDHNSKDKKETKPLPSPQVPGRRRLARAPKLEGGTRCSRSRSLSTSRTKTSLSLSELTELCAPPPGKPARRSRSKSCSKTKKSFGKDNNNIKDSSKEAAVRSTPIITSSSKLVEEKIKEITKSKKSFGKADYTELGKLNTMTMKDDENTLPTTPESFKSKQAVFTFDKKSGLIVELYNDKESDETVPSSNRRRDTFTRGCK